MASTAFVSLAPSYVSSCPFAASLNKCQIRTQHNAQATTPHRSTLLVMQTGQQEKSTRLVKVSKPLGLKLEELRNKNIVVVGIDPAGNGATQGKIVPGEVILGIKDEQGTKINLQSIGLDRALEVIQNSEGSSLELVLEPSLASADSGFSQKDINKQISSQVREKLRKEIVSPYKNNWILIIIGVVLSLVLASYVML